MLLTRRRACYLTAVALTLLRTPGPIVAASRPPKLVVLIVVDQMRADYVERFQHQWTAGLRRLLREGAWFRQAAYPYHETLTCVGHATISTGTFPASHGIIQNSWWDRASGRTVLCTADSQAPVISYGRQIDGGHSAARLMMPTLGDELRAQANGSSRVATFSVKPRSAIMLAGHRAEAVVWFDDRGAWATSAAYASAPVPFVEQFVQANPVERDANEVWTRALPEAQYLYEDDGIGERPPVGWTTTFPHALGGRSDPAFYDRWRQSPFADEYLAEMAVAAVQRLQLGKGPGIDLLGVSFSTLDNVGHGFGPHSHEVQDVLLRLDGSIGRLLDGLDTLVGPGEYVVAFSADHGVSPIPERSRRDGLDAGRLDPKGLPARVDRALGRFLGEGSYVAAVVYTDLYFAPGIYEKLLANPVAMNAALDAIRETPGVWRVYRGDELRERPNGADPVARAAALSYYPGRSGDLVIVPRPHWITSPDGATHGTLYGYDARVPLILMGRHFAAGEYFEPATPADIAPTLALLCGVTLAHPEGRVLREALTGPERGRLPEPAPAPR